LKPAGFDHKGKTKTNRIIIDRKYSDQTKYSVEKKKKKRESLKENIFWLIRADFRFAGLQRFFQSNLNIC